MRRRLGIGIIAGLLLATAYVNRTPAADNPGLVGQFNLKPLGAEGLSALWIAPGGLRLIAVSDRSLLIKGEIGRDAQGRITSVTLTHTTPLLAPGRQGSEPVTIDSEGIAVGPQGDIYVSTEGPARVLRYDSQGENPVIVGRARDFGPQLQNGALEALAIGPNGAIFTLAETESRALGPFELFADTGLGWHIFATLPRKDSFLPVSADIGPDGKLYILYCSFSVLKGFSTRLQRMELTKSGLAPPEDLLETGYGQHGNLEGLSIWRDALGRLTASMVTDDNGNFFQSAEIVEYRLDD